MIRAVLDTNVVVSALISPAGPLADLLDLAALQRFRCYVSEEILHEYLEVLGRAHLKLDEHKTFRAIERLKEAAILVKPQKKLLACTDSGDNKFLECALEARADYVVTGNARHFPVRFQGVRVIIPRRFLTLLAADPR